MKPMPKQRAPTPYFTAPGFTLIEAGIALAVIGLVVGGIWVAGNKAQTSVQVTTLPNRFIRLSIICAGYMLVNAAFSPTTPRRRSMARPAARRTLTPGSAASALILPIWQRVGRAVLRFIVLIKRGPVVRLSYCRVTSILGHLASHLGATALACKSGMCHLMSASH